MSFSCEKEFVKRDYYESTNLIRLSNYPSSLKRIFSYYKKYNETACIILDHEEVFDKWHFSYPMKNKIINYKVTFDSKKELIKYINTILDNNVLE
jgi:hypothetical protein|tara:strand:+ start:1949 stop:2233 length:285 start_codon:yes stop_codon:yes gene_type:complete